GPAKHAPDAEPHKRVTGAGTHTASSLPSHTRGGSRMRESRTYGSVRGARDETRVPTATVKGGSNETSPPKAISSSGRTRYPPAGRLTLRLGASLSDAPSAHYCRLARRDCD